MATGRVSAVVFQRRAELIGAGFAEELYLMRKKNRFQTVYALMYWDGFDGRKSLCAIFSSQQRADRYAEKLKKKLKKKLIQPEDAYIVDAWHVNGAHDS